MCGKLVVNDMISKMVTIDYVAEGNWNLKKRLNTVKRVDTGILLRDIMMNDVEQISLQKKDVTSKIDDRAVIL